ncbi:MAG: aspartate-semialdehyde dehydrogenase [Phycisphaeraceae bacterium]|nr:aspartate-semialdehyde dehydrogenase [Phycisphaerae bacterium]MBX3391743.1 aspartate-semialdehyde dehydrogenase [Phycisphaeraceae bacterium]
MRHPLTVLKFGGSVLRAESDLDEGVQEAYRWVRSGSRVVVVVSAFEGTTDALLRKARSYDRETQDAACALLLATGEFTAASLLSLAFARAGLTATVLGPQAIRLRTRGSGVDADPASVDRAAIDRALEDAAVVIVPGFVGIDGDGQFALLGRGGSDLTALFLAAELSASRCRLIKDVDGLYERDPALPSPTPRRYRTASWESALTLDGGIIQHKAVLLARSRGLAFEVGAFHRADATTVGPRADEYYAAAPPARPLRVAVLGAGTVGAGVVAGVLCRPGDLEVTRIAVRDVGGDRGPEIPASLLTPSLLQAASATGDDVVVELIGGIETAYHAVRAALSAGKHVVTANKALIARHGAELTDLAVRSGVTIRWSAAVGGAAPMIEAIAALRRTGAVIERVEGVVNGTTNHVLDRVEAGVAFDLAVREAHERGYAEADPSRDLDGLDAADKLAILAWHAFDERLNVDDIPRIGIRAETVEALASRRREGQVIRLIASARRTPEGVVASVEPRLIDARHPLGAARGVRNSLLAWTGDGRATFAAGSGAGRHPTALSVVADLLDLRRELHSTSPGADSPGTDLGSGGSDIRRAERGASVRVTGAARAGTGRFTVAGATGAVGREVLSILSARGVAAHRVVALASESSAGSTVPYGGAVLRVASLREDSFRPGDLALFATGAEVARRFAPMAVASGSWVVDNSSAFRLDPKVPLIVPEINGSRLTRTVTPPRLVANPNCSTVILLTSLEPLRRDFGVRSIVVATYQAVSGAGLGAIEELRTQTRRVLDGAAAEPSYFREPCAFNVFSHDSAVDEQTGLNGEERKIIDEARKIWMEPDLPITPTCVRVPVVRAHTQAITVRLGRPASEAQVRESLAGGAGIRVIDDRRENRFPTPLLATGRDEVLVGRVRPDPAARPAGGGVCDSWCLLVSGDQLRKGAATNAVQIADLLMPAG